MKKINLDAVKYDNYLLNQQEIRDKKIILKSKPLSLILTITGECQLNCIMCPVKKIKPLTISSICIKEIIKLYGREAFTVQWMGGEPLLHPDFEEFITVANNAGLFQTVTTNGLLLNGMVAAKLIKYNSDIIISIDGSAKPIYESVRKGADFDLLIDNIKYVNDLRKKYNHAGHFGINFCILKQNSEDIINIVEFSKKYNFKGINFIFPYDTDKKITADIDEKLRKNFLTAEKKAKDYKIEFTGWSPFANDAHIKNFDNNKMLCYSPFYSFGINPYGKPDICIYQNLSFTDKQEIKDLNESWNAKQVQKYRENTYNNILPSDKCKNCSGIGFRHFYHPQIVNRLNSIKI